MYGNCGLLYCIAAVEPTAAMWMWSSTMKRILCVRLSNGPSRPWVERCGRFSPTVGLEPTDDKSILLDITGLAHLFGGETALCKAIVRDFYRHGQSVRAAVADTIGAAWAVAQMECNEENAGSAPSPFAILPSGTIPVALAPLPIEMLRLPDETLRLLHELGITNIGHVEALPRNELSSRFGPVLLVRLDQAFGRLDEPVHACPIPQTFEADWSAEYPTARRETIETALEHLIQRVAAMLACCGRGALRLECQLYFEIRNPQSAIQPLPLSVGLFQPTAAADHLYQLVQLQLERLRIASPVTDISVAATLTAPLKPHKQTLLFEVVADDLERQDSRQLATLVERLSSRLGGQSVSGVRLRPEAQPELSWHYDSLVDGRRRRRAKKTPSLVGGTTGSAASAGQTPAPRLAPRPLRLLPRPQPLALTSIAPEGPPLWFYFAGKEQQIAHTWGPERIETGWWRGRPVGRDYFRVETTAGRRFWLFCRLRDGKWFLHGTFE